MKNIFVVTNNVECASGMITRLRERDKGVPGLALIYGDPGLGKTRFALWLADRMGAVFVRALATSTVRSFLEDLVYELGLDPMFRAADLYRQARKALIENPRLVIIDEVDRLAANWQALETLRDLADETGTAMVLIGMDASERKLSRFRHFFYRLKSHIYQFTPLSEADLKRFAEQICDVAFDDSAISDIHKMTAGRIGDVIGQLYKAERIAQANNFKTIEGKHLRRAAA
jgi:DNA transposition AAA+ family ATPase